MESIVTTVVVLSRFIFQKVSFFPPRGLPIDVKGHTASSKNHLGDFLAGKTGEKCWDHNRGKMDHIILQIQRHLIFEMTPSDVSNYVMKL